LPAIVCSYNLNYNKINSFKFLVNKFKDLKFKDLNSLNIILKAGILRFFKGSYRGRKSNIAKTLILKRKFKMGGYGFVLPDF